MQRLRSALSVPVVVGLTVFLIAVVVAAVVLVSQMRPASEASQSLVSDLVEGPIQTDGSAHEAEESGSLEHDVIFVHVVGEVGAPGVVEVPTGARISDVIAAAGGATEAAELHAVNLAREAVDGEQVVVPNAEQVAAGGTAAAPPVDAAAQAGGAGTPQPGQLIDLNTADAAQLETLPRVGPALAQRIIDWRQQNGRFASVEDLLNVSGIGAKTLDGFRDLVRVS